MASEGALNCRLTTQAIFLLLFVGVVIWLSVVYGAFAGAIDCIVQQWYVLKSITQGNVGAQLQASLAAVPELFIQTLVGFTYLIYAIIIPAAIVWLCQIFLIGSTCKEKNGRGVSSCCSKCAISVIIVFGLVCFVLYLVVGALGLASTSAEGQVASSAFQNWCRTELPTVEKELKDAEAVVTLLGDTDSPELRDAKVEIDASRRALDALTVICGCTDNLWTALAGLVGAGFVSAVVALLVIIINCVTCCQLGCCCRKEEPNKGVTMQGAPGGGVAMTGI